MKHWNETSDLAVSCQDATLQEGPGAPGACPPHARAAEAFLQAARRLPLASFEVRPADRAWLELLGPQAACSSADPAQLEALGSLPAERMLSIDFPVDWGEVGRACARLGPLTLIVPRPGRLDPIELSRLFREAGGWGCRGLVLSDERAEIGPHGVGYLVRFARRLREDMGLTLELTWGGSNRYGTALAQALEALEAGADRIRGCALGLGRTGSVPLDQLLAHTGLADPGLLADYRRTAALCLGLVVPPHYPGIEPELRLGPLSTREEVRAWLRQNGLPPEEEVVGQLLALARASSSPLSDLQLMSAAGVPL